MLAGRVILIILLVGLFSPIETAMAQANGDPGGAMLGIALARAHAEARTARGIQQWRHEVNAWQDLRKITQEAAKQ